MGACGKRKPACDTAEYLILNGLRPKTMPHPEAMYRLYTIVHFKVWKHCSKLDSKYKSSNFVTRTLHAILFAEP